MLLRGSSVRGTSTVQVKSFSCNILKCVNDKISEVISTSCVSVRAVKVSYIHCEVYGLYREMHVAEREVD